MSCRLRSLFAVCSLLLACRDDRTADRARRAPVDTASELVTLELGDVVVTVPIPRGWSAHATRSGGQLISVTFTPDHHGQSIRVMQSCFGACDAIDRNLAELLDRRRDSFTSSGWTVDVVRATSRVGATAFELRITSGASVTFDTTRAEHQPAWRQAIECQSTSSGELPRPAVRTACDRMTLTTAP